MLPSIHSIAGDTYVFQQDSAAAHRACQMVELLHCETPKFIASDLWPPNIPDINLVLWNMRCYEDCVYQTPVQDVSDLKQRLADTWNGLPQSIVDDADDEWQKRLKACVKEKGKHFEHFL